MLSLDDLASDWLAPGNEENFALPAITNFHGMVQAAWDVAGVQNWICAPTGMNTPTALLFFRDGDRIRRFPRRGIEYRWKAYEIERRGHGVSSAVRMPPDANALLLRLSFERPVEIFVVIGGLPRVWRFTDYWNLPPEDVPQFNVTLSGSGEFALSDTKTFGRARIRAAGNCRVYSDLQAWLDGDEQVEHGRVGVVRFHATPGSEFTIQAVQGCERELPEIGDADAAWRLAKAHWESVWQAAFTPGNREFSGHLPAYSQVMRDRGDDAPDLARLYYMSVLSLLMTRRFIPAATPRSLVATGGQCVWTPPEAHAAEDETGESAPPKRDSKRESEVQQSPVAGCLERAYVWGGPEGAPTTSFLWEVYFQAPLLARLDPGVLRAQLEALMRVDLGKHWGFETISGSGAGMAYGVNPGAFLSCVADYVRITGDRSWALAHVDYLKRCLRPKLTDYGDCQNILECVSTYEHTVASFNALGVHGLRFMAELTGEEAYGRQAAALAKEIEGLYAGGPWACVQPDGSRRIVKTILDFVYVGRLLASDLPDVMKSGMATFFAGELQTEDWLYALAPSDPDALTRKLPTFQTFRADHQATGSYDGWPALAASALLRFGERKKAIAWLCRLQELTREGPFGQAHFIHAAESDEAQNRSFPSRTRKASFFNGNCYFESAGCGYATTILEDL